VEKGVAWNRPSKPFHVIFQVTSDKADNFHSRLNKKGVDISELSLV